MGKPYRECPRCGAHLDAGELCDCGDQKRKPQAAEDTPRRMRLVAICREVDKATGRIAVYPIEAEINDHVLYCLKIRARANEELRYFTITSVRWERFREVIAGILKRRTVTTADVDRIGGIVEL